MFRRVHHRRIQRILDSLDGGKLAECECWFGGGTAITLMNGEYRESLDIDFLVSDYVHFRRLRAQTAEGGIQAISNRALKLAKPISADRYGIRTAILVDGTPIKFEIVHEGRINLDVPEASQTICGIRTLTPADQVASKLLANDDRWADRSVFSRDLIDLSMMRPQPAVLRAGLRKAESAYGPSIRESWEKAVDMLRSNPKQLTESVRALQIDVPASVVWNEINNMSQQIAE